MCCGRGRRRSTPQDSADLFGRHPVDRHALAAAACPADDADAAARKIERGREEVDERRVGGAVHWRWGEADQQRAVALAGQFGALCPGDDADVQNRSHCVVAAITLASHAARTVPGLRRSRRQGVEDAIVAVARVLLAHELERVAERLDRRFDRRLDVAALQLEAVDLALDVGEPRLGLVEGQLGSALRLAQNALRFVLGVRLDLVGQLLRGDERRLERPLVLAVLVDDRFHAHHVLADAVGVAQRLLVVLGHGGEERRDFDAVEAAERGAEALLAEVERADIHARFFSRWLLSAHPGSDPSPPDSQGFSGGGGQTPGCGGGLAAPRVSASEHPRVRPLGGAAPGYARAGGLTPKMAVPTRTMVAPSSTATS